MGFLSLGLFFPCLLFFSSSAWACSCGWPGPPAQAFENAPAIFIGEVIGAKERNRPSAEIKTGLIIKWHIEYTVKVEKSWKGVVNDTVTMIREFNSPCSYGGLKKGDRLLFYVGRSDEGYYYGPGAPHCTRNKPADSALVEALILDAVVAKKDLSTVYRQLPGMIRNHPDPLYRGDAALYLAFETPDPLPKDTLPALLAGLKDPHPRVRGNVALALIKERFRKHRELLAPVLEAALDREETLLKKSSDPALNEYAIRQISGSLVAYGNRAARKKTVPHFIRDLESTEYFIYSNAVRQLKIIGPDAQAAVPALKRLLEKAETIPGMRTGRMWILEAMKEIQPQGSLKEIIKALDHKDCGMLVEAVKTLDKIDSPRTRKLLRVKGVPRLIEQLKSYSCLSLDRYTLRELDVPLSSYVPQLIEISNIYTSKTGNLLMEIRSRMTVIQILGDIGPKAQLAVPVLKEILNDSDKKVRSVARSALTSIEGSDPKKYQPTLSELKKELTYPETPNWYFHLRMIKNLETPEALKFLNYEIVPGLIAKWKSGTLSVQKSRYLVEGLGNLAPQVQGIFPVLVEALDQADESTRNYAIRGLKKYGRKAQSAVSKLIELLKDKASHKESTRRGIVLTLEAIGTPQAETGIRDYARWYVPDLVQRLANKGDLEQREVPYYMMTLIPYTEDLLPRLIAVLKEDDFKMSKEMLRVLNAMGSQAKEAVPLITTLFKKQWQADEEDWQKTIQIIHELNLLGPEHPGTSIKRSELLELLQRPELATRMFWVDTLMKFGTAEARETAELYRRRVLPHLKKVITCDYKKARQQGVALLRKVAKGSKIALNLLISGLDDEAKRVRREAVLALRDLGPAAAPAVPKLTFLLKEEGNFVGSAIPIALKAIGTEEALQALQ